MFVSIAKSKISWQKGFIKLSKHTLVSYLIVSTVLVGTGIIFLFNPFGTKSAEAAWFDDSWGYRQEVPVTANTGVDTNTYISFSLDTATLITAGKLQSSCQDIRVTDVGGNVLAYHVGRTNACNLSNTTIDALVPTLGAGASTFYVYYGNSSVVSKDAGAFSQSEAASYTVGTLGTEAKAPSPTLYWKMDEGSGTSAKNSGREQTSRISFVQSKSNRTFGTSISATFDSTPNAGNLIVAVCGAANTSISITDNKSNTYTTVQSFDFSGIHRLSYAKNISSSATFTVTCTAGSDSNLTIAAFEYSGADTNSPLDQSTNNTGFDTTSPSTGSITTTENNELIFAIVEVQSASITFTPTASGFTQREERESGGANLFNAMDRLGDVGSYNGTWTQSPSDNFVGIIASFKPANLVGTLNNTPTWKTEDFCVASKCLYFDGANNENVSKSDDAKLDFVAADNFTIQAWVKRNGASAAVNYILTKAQSGYTGYKLYQDASGDYCFDVSDGTNTDTACTSAVEFDDDKWHLVTGVKAATTSITLYVDGNQRAQDASIAATGTLANTGTFYTGVDLDGTTSEWLGYIDEVKVYRDNTARTAAQVLADFNARSNNEGASAALGAQQSKALSDGLVGYWKFDEGTAWATNCSTESVLDSSGNSNDGAPCPNASAATQAAGKFGKAASLDGINDYIDVDNATSLNLNTTDRTTSGWVMDTNANFNHDSAFIMIKGDTDADGNVPYYSRIYFNEFHACVRTSFSLLDAHCAIYDLSTDPEFAVSRWFHYAAVYTESSDTIRLYLNGKLKVTATVTFPSAGNTTALYFGANADQLFFTGRLDETRIYNRALSAAEVTQLYNFAPGPVGEWKFEEGTGTNAADSSGLDNAGTLTNSPTYTIGKYGKGLNFAGSNAHVTRADDSDFDFGTAASFTLEGYFKHASTPATVERILTKYDATAGNGGFAVQIETDGDITCGIDDDETSFPEDSVTSTAATYDDDLWHHFACVKDGTSSLTLYIDGVSVGTPDTSISSTGDFANADPLYIGIAEDGTSNDYLGSLDEIRIFNYARSQKQVVESANAGHPAPGSPVGSATLHLKFDEGADNMCSAGTNDVCNSGSGGNSLDGTLTATSRTTAGKFGQALDGGDQRRAAIADNASLDFAAGTDDFTLTAWFNRAASISAAEYILDKHTTNDGYTLYMDSDGDIVCGIGDGAAAFPEETIGGSLTKNYDDGAWHHAACVKTGTTSLRLYVDGREIASDTSLAVTGDMSNTGSFYVGDANATDGTDEFLGDMDEVKVYRSALTDAQVTLDMNQGKSQVLGALSDKSGNQPQSANNEYCIPGDSSTCTAPVGEWKMEEGTGTTAFDTSTNGNTGTITGATYSTGKFGKGLTFDSTDYVTVTDSSSLDLTSSFTLSSWVKTTTTSNVVILEKSADNTNYLMHMSAGNPGGITCRAASASSTVSSVTDVNDGKWHFVNCVFDNTGDTIKVFIDGKEDNSASATDAPSANATNLLIGSRTGTAPFPGDLDNIEIFNYARSHAQIAWDYNQGKPVAHWKMDECQGTTINDSAGNSLTGTLTIGALGSEDTVGTCATSSTAWGNGATGKKNYSLDFDGTDDEVTVLDNTLLDITEDFTLSAWIKAPSIVANMFVVSKTNATDNLGGYGMLLGANGEFYCRTAHGSGWDDSSTALGVVTANSWFHTLVVRSGTSCKVYVNGADRTNTVDTHTTLTANAHDLRIGTRPNEGGEFWDGQIDDVRIYNYALTAKQIQGVMNEGAIRYGPVTGAP